ncbi:uncharacterized protein LTR77_007341 [Saxophila tyrrhenica]|uniref:PH domain-containing protein n=1 Tax=Saxophila tyrrhenica TaxID=1690608 RepID=A0AAV9P883_9PEZI|nr:hypothetical protein LTR77_007341 [Saxophila tyrrhenica]
MAEVAPRQHCTPHRVVGREIPISTLPVPIFQHATGFRAFEVGLDTFNSPVNENGVFAFDRIIKHGEVLKRTRKTKSWKSVFLVLRPNVLSIYRDKEETKLRHRILLSDLTAVARQRDRKRKDKQHVFGLFSPSRNYHLEALSDEDAQEWVEVIRREARIDRHEEELMLSSPGGANTSQYQGFERSIDAQISAGAEERSPQTAGYASSSDADALVSGYALPRSRTHTQDSTLPRPPARQPSFAEYSGAERTSMSDFSDTAGPAARLSTLSLAQTIDPRPSTSSTQPVPNTIYGTSAPARPNAGPRNPSQLSTLRTLDLDNPERVLYLCWAYLLKSKSGVRQWKKVWVVIRPSGMALYKNEEEYAALLVLSIGDMIDAVEIDNISKSKTWCMQILTEERNYRFSCGEEEVVTRCLGALKSLISKRKARRKEMEAAAAAQAAASTS